MKRIATVGVVSLAMIAVFAVVARGESAHPAEPAAMDSGGNFASICRFDHRLSDDPIVSPGAAGASHNHDFFGNTTTDASSTYVSLQAGDTSCNREADTAAYWVPTLLVDGVAVRPRAVQAYYNARGKPDVVAPPAGLEVVAGDGKAIAPQPISVVAWHCGEHERSALSSTPPTCPERTMLRLQVRFPDCWDGVHLDSADHKSHMAYSSRRACPSTHPVPLAGLRVTVFYPTRGGDGVSLSSTGVFSGHADFFNAWNQVELARLTTLCLNEHHRCGRNG